MTVNVKSISVAKIIEGASCSKMGKCERTGVKTTVACSLNGEKPIHSPVEGPVEIPIVVCMDVEAKWQTGVENPLHISGGTEKRDGIALPNQKGKRQADGDLSAECANKIHELMGRYFPHELVVLWSWVDHSTKLDLPMSDWKAPTPPPEE